MLYCFAYPDLLYDNEFVIQASFCKSNNSFIMYDEEKDVFLDKDNNIININKKHIFLRCSYDLFETITDKILKHNGIPLELPADKVKIENWNKLGISKRKIYECRLSDLLSSNKPKVIIELLTHTDRIFIKTKEKAFSLTTSSNHLLDNDSETIGFLKNKLSIKNYELMLSKEYSLKKDSIGVKEVRLFVVDNKVINCSRNIHSLMHNVPPSLEKEGIRIVKLIKDNFDFPKNYVIDLCIFAENGNEFIDIVEINPISCSLCYINNSIFETSTCDNNAVISISKETGMGLEYCFDYLNNKSRYSNERFANKNYSYTSEERFIFWETT